MQLPESNKLPINLLSSCFNNTSATYKYYWLLSILQEFEIMGLTISKKSLFSRMIANSWYTVNYFRVSFGTQDLIQDTIHLLRQTEEIPIDEKLNSIFQKLVSTNNKTTERALWHFNKNVPHWFLSPWFPSTSKTDIYQASKRFDGNCLYALYDDRIEINPAWKDYFITNVRVLKDFCYWNLTLFLQIKNPNVPDIPNKLIKPAKRNNLTQQRTKFWDLVINELGLVKCIYTGEVLTVGNYVIEHFIPYNFVSHDLIWNLIPSNKKFNSSKSDKLPPLNKYFNPFYDMHKSAVEIVGALAPKNKFLEEYLTIFPDLNRFTKDNFKEVIQPLITIASNNGFEFLA